MLDISVAYNRYKFLGCEFLTWLWFSIEQNPSDLMNTENPSGILSLGRKIKFENQRNNQMESVSVTGDNPDFKEGLTALKKGALVAELHLIYDENEHRWQFAVTGENINFSNIKHPETGPVETAEDNEGFILEKVYHYRKVFSYMDALYKKFVQLRLSQEWSVSIAPQLRKWIKS